MSLEVFGIPTCDTCRKARKWLDAQGIDHAWIDLRKSPPSRAQVSAWVQTLGSKALKNTSGGSYRALGDEKKSWDDARWAKALGADPMLLKRPVLVKDGVALTTGFKVHQWKELLG